MKKSATRFEVEVNGKLFYVRAENLVLNPGDSVKITMSPTEDATTTVVTLNTGPEPDSSTLGLVATHSS